MALKLVGWDDDKCRPIYVANTNQKKKSPVREKFPEETTSKIITENVRSLFLSPSQKNVRNIELQEGNVLPSGDKPYNRKRRKSNRIANDNSNRKRSRYKGRKESCEHHQITRNPIPFNANISKSTTRYSSTKLPSSITVAVDFVSQKPHGHAKSKVVYDDNKWKMKTEQCNEQHLSGISNKITPQAKGENHQDNISAIAKPSNFSPSQKQNNPRTNSNTNENSLSDIAFECDDSENRENKKGERVKCSSFSSKKCGSLNGTMVPFNRCWKERQSSCSDALVGTTKHPTDSVEGPFPLPLHNSNEIHFTNNHISSDSTAGKGRETQSCSLKSGTSSYDEKSSIDLQQICPEFFNSIVTPFDKQRDTNRVDFVLANHDSAVDSGETDVIFSESSIEQDSRSYEGDEETHLDECGIGHSQNTCKYANESSRRNLHTERTTTDSNKDRIISSGMQDDIAADCSSSVILASDESDSILSAPNVRPHKTTDDLQYFSEEFDIFQNNVDDEEKREQKNEIHSLPKQSNNQPRPRRSYGSAIKNPIWIPSNKLCNQITSKSTKDSVAAQIGWDDEKCRPIFYAPNTNKQHLFEEEEPSSAGDTKMKSSFSLGETDNDNCENLGVRSPAYSQKRRVYGSTWKERRILKPNNDHFSSPLKLPTAIYSAVFDASEREKPTPGSDPRNQPRNDIEVLSAAKYQDSEPCRRKIDDLLREERVRMIYIYGDASSATRAALNVDDDCNARNDNAAPPLQVSSKTSLNLARAYFQHLDANHNLTLLNDDDAADICNVKNDVIRTSRTLKNFKRNAQFRDEYRNYCETLSGSGVQPISMKEFAENWNRYFTERGVIRDGLLDEEW